MSKAKENQTTNLRKAKCGCTINGLKHDTEILANEGFIVRTQSNDYKVYCKECYEKLTKGTLLNLRSAENKTATIQGNIIPKVTIRQNWEHTFEFYVSDKNIDTINLLKRMHFTIIKADRYTMNVISGKETNLNGLQKTFKSLVKNFNLSEETEVKIITYNNGLKVNTSKETLLKAIAKAKEDRCYI